MPNITSSKSNGKFGVRVSTTFESKVPSGECVTKLMLNLQEECRFYGSVDTRSIDRAKAECYKILASSKDEPKVQVQYETYLQLLDEAQQHIEKLYLQYRENR